MSKIKIVNEVVSFRHPLVKGADGYPKKFMKGFKKLSRKEQAEISESLEKLLERKPENKKAVEGLNLHDVAVAWYFEPMGLALDSDTDQENEDRASKNMGDYKKFMSIRGDNEYIQRLERKLKEKDAYILVLQNALGMQSEEVNSLTLKDAFETFKKSFKASTEATTDSVCANIEAVLNAIGFDTKIVSVTLQTLEKTTCDMSNIVKRVKGIKTFFSFLSRPKIEGGLEIKNPSENLKIPTTVLPENEMLNPSDVFAKCELTLAQKCLIGLQGYAGLRLSEASGLKWTDIDFDSCSIKVATNEERKTLKTAKSYRQVPMFPNLVPLLLEYKASCTDTNGMMFYKNEATKTTWLEFDKGNTNSRELSVILTAVIKDAFTFKSEKAKPNNLFRHFYTTEFMKTEFAKHESIIGGHSKDISEKHYQNAVEIVKGIKLKAI